MEKSGFNKDVAKMRSLIERMGGVFTGRQAMLNEERYLNEAKLVDRHEYNDLVRCLWDYKNGMGKFVGLGYVVHVPVYKRLYPSAGKDEKLSGLISKYGDNADNGEWVGKLSGIRDNEGWQSIVGGNSKKKTVSGDWIDIIAIIRMNIQWQDGKKFGNWYNERMKGEDELMQRYGIEPMEYMQQKEVNKERQNYPTIYTDKYKNGELPIFGATKGGERQYYSNGDQKMALKQVATFVKVNGISYYYLDSHDKYVEIPGDVVHFLSKEIGVDEAKEVKEKVEDIADTFENAIKQYKAETSKMIKQFLLREIGYLAFTGVNSITNQKESVAFVNKDVDPSEGSSGYHVNGAALYPILAKFANVAKEETKEMAQNAGDDGANGNDESGQV